VTANQLTALGLVLAIVASIVIATGHLVPGALLIAACGAPDLLDGAVAKATATTSARGALFDSVADRVTDALLLGAVAWYLASTGHGHLTVLPLGVLAGSMLVSYVRARAEALGLSAKGGLMERAERLVILGFGVGLQAFFPALVPALWLLLALTGVTVVQRFRRAWRQAPAVRREVPERRSTLWRSGRVESRWRAWRETAAARAATGEGKVAGADRSSLWGQVGGRGAGLNGNGDGAGAPLGRQGDEGEIVGADDPGRAGSGDAGETDEVPAWWGAGSRAAGAWWAGRSRGTGAPSGRWRARRSGDPVERWRARRTDNVAETGRRSRRRASGDHGR
jgi:CDP-diacylglycerol--glycerol-3-phosphate 3-phosphatidyltransferase